MHKLTRRNVIATLSGSAVLLCPALLNAQTSADLSSWDGIETTKPINENQLLTVAAGPVEVEVAGLTPGQVAVIARPNDGEDYSATEQVQYIAVLRRTEEQMAHGAANDIPGASTDPNYLVVELICPHRGKAIAMTGDPAVPFACTDRRGRHSSEFDAAGNGIAGASDGDPMTVPAHSIAVNGDQVVLSLS